MKLKKFVLAFVLIVSNIVMSQNCNYTFSGVVEDFHDKSTLAGATIYIKNLNKYTTSDLYGKFSIPNLCKGIITVEIAHLGCKTLMLEININNDIYKTIDLEHHVEELENVHIKTIVGKKTKTAQETVVKSTTLEKFSDQSLGDALKEVSGVSSINTGNSIVKPVINGLHSSRVLIAVNGVRLQDQDWGIEHAPNVDVNSAGTLSVIKGANALQYGGDAIGGVVVLNPLKVIKKDTLLGKTIISQQSNGYLTSVNSTFIKSYEKGWFINGQASYKRSGDFKAPDYNLTNTGIHSKGFSIHTGFNDYTKGIDIQYNYLKNELGILRSSHIGSTSDLIEALKSDVPLVINDFSYDINNPKQDITHHLFKANVYKRIKALGKLSFQYDYQHNRRLEFDIRRGDRSNIASADLKLQTHVVKADMNFDSKSDKNFKAGIMASYQDNFANPDTGVRRLIPDYDKTAAGIYFISEFDISNDLTFDAGVRYDFNYINAKKYYLFSRWEDLNYDEDYSAIIIDETSSQYLTNPILTYHNVSSSLGLSYEVNQKNAILFNLSLASRPPNPSELFSDGLHHSAARIELGNLRITPENSYRVSSTYKFNTNNFNFNVEAFFNRINDFIFIEPTSIETTLRGSFLVWEYNQTNATLFGFDTNANYVFNDHFSIHNKLSFLKGKNNSENVALIDMPPFKSVSSIEFKNKKWNHFYANLEHEFNARQNEFPNNNFTIYVASTDTDEYVDISTPPNAYHLFNFSTGFDIQMSQTKININFSVDNVLNTSYRNYLNRLRYYADDLGRNFKIQLKINY